ncbi:MAG: hypothetical protein B6245_17370 [Desulfobacteraceae bacterium 4572_88]|nr:MAG: hypothetical protein B6245_17370 [Desulfobacteraceae bacterium 4572_88]
MKLPSDGPSNVQLILNAVDADGTGTISGQITLPEGSPAPYAEVYADTDDYTHSLYTEADESGMFTLENIPEGSWIISAYLRDDSDEYGSPETVTLEMTSAGGTQNLAEPLILASVLDIGEVPVGQIHGSVILPNTQPVPNTFVHAENDDYTEFASAQTDENGNFTLTGLADGTWTLHATPPYDNKDFEQYVPSMPLQVELMPDYKDITLEHSLVLHQSVKHIQGFVKKGDQGMGNILVFASNWDTPDGFKEVKTKADGKFDIWVGHGTWEVGVFQSHEALWVLPEPKTVEFSDDDKAEMESMTFVLSEPDGSLSGQILPRNADQFPPPEGDDVGAGIELFNRDTGYSVYVALNPDGKFHIPLPFGTYEAYLWLDPERYPDFASPVFEPVEIDGGEKKVGIIYLEKRDATIRGAVTDAQGTGIPGIFVSAWQPDGAYYDGETDSRGNYKISVSPGKWIVEPSVGEDAGVLFTGYSQEVWLKPGDVRMISPFEMEDVGNVIIGTVQAEDGTKLTDLVAWAYARLENSPRPVSKARVENGEFRMNVPAGTLYVGLRLDMQSRYSLKEELTPSGNRSRSASEMTGTSATAGAAIAEMRPYEQAIQASQRDAARKSSKDDLSVTITLTSNDAFIRGTLKNAAGEAVTGVSGHVSATPDDSGHAWQEAEINTADGSFNIPVSGGVWNLSYELGTDAYMSSPLEPIQVQVTTGTTETQDITLTDLGQEVSGTVKDPEGKLVSNTRVWMRVPYGDGTFDTQMTTDSEGRFTFSLPTNNVDQGTGAKKASKDTAQYVYCVGTAQSYCGSDINCLMQSITTCQQYYLRKRSPSSKDNDEIVLTLRSPDAAVQGTVFGGNGETVEGAFVTAYSVDGQKAADYTDENGAYELNVAKSAEEGGSDIWIISAVYKPAEDNVYYRSTEARLDISGDETEITGPDLSLKRMGILPPSETHEFRVEEGWSHTLSDGAMIQIPPDAFRTLNKEVTIVIEPRMEDLPDNAEDRNVSYGYVITIYENSTGKEIVDEFNKDVLVTLRYTDDQLEASGIREADIRPAYYLPASDSWQTVKHFTIDKKNNKIIFPTKHFSTWSLVAMRSDTGTPDPGDINNDGSLALGDLILALRVCANFSLSSGVVNLAADVNSDVKIGLEEAVYILRAIAANN